MIEDEQNKPIKPSFSHRLLNVFKRRGLKKDYQKKDFTNPYFNRPHQKKIGFNTILYLKIIAGLLVLYVVFYSDLFRINNVQISTDKLIDNTAFSRAINDNLNSWRFFILPQKNMIFFSAGDLYKQLNSKFKLENLSVSRGWKTVGVWAVSKPSFLIIYNGQQFYLTDEDGQITAQVDQNLIGDYTDKLPILNVAQSQINVGDKITSREMVDFILELNRKAPYYSLQARGYETMAGDEVTLVTRDLWRAYFDTNQPIDQALNNLSLVLKQQIKNQKINYIDLRFGEKVFYK
ncbi:MAG: cell division protein FtsQ/DivIB [bacterium]